jgi:UDPglucose--hexose-1-phosphate uridylyltransferase
MSVLRQDPTTKEWVIVATERARRPHDFKKQATRSPAPARDPLCPFCPGNEAKTPGELLRLGDEAKSGWSVRVVPNKFPAVVSGGELQRRELGPLFREMDGVGHHEVIVESQRHDLPVALMSAGAVELVLRAYQERYRVLREDSRVKYLIIFRNHGQTAGTSLEHPHSQLVATPIAPMLLRRKYEVAIGHYDDTGRCLYCDLVEEELAARVRVVQETDDFVVFHPYASRVPFETWIAPKRHQPSFGLVEPQELSALSGVLRQTLYALHTGLGDPDFNYIVHSAPMEDETKAYYLWHIQILPRLTTIAGFELGSGIFITTMLPEESAAFVREIPPPPA